jgi:hypothetical protein
MLSGLFAGERARILDPLMRGGQLKRECAQTKQYAAPIQPLQVLDETVCVRSDSQHPLPHGAPDDGVPPPLAEAVDDLRAETTAQ